MVEVTPEMERQFQLNRIETKLDAIAEHLASQTPRGAWLAQRFIDVGMAPSTPRATEDNLRARAR